tara:strand:- start:3528 stop:5906 length:2379 start_codon:yes stop_codon:yes gene_type:complete
MKKILLIFLLFLTSSVFAIDGKVVDKETGEALPFVNIKVMGQNKGTVTDFDGNYDLEVYEGDTLRFSFVSYVEKMVIVDSSWDGNVLLEQYHLELNEFKVVAKRDIGSEKVILIDKKNSNDITSTIGQEEIEKKGVLNTTGAVKKVAGVSVKKSKTIVVRGLHDRYNQVTLNSLPVSSISPDVTNLDITILPTGIASNVSVSKSYSSNLYSQSTGGTINFNTKIPIEQSTKFSLGGGYNLGYNFSEDFAIYRNKFSILFKHSYSNKEVEGFTRIVNRQGNVSLDYDWIENNTTNNYCGLVYFDKTLNSLFIKNISLINYNTSDATRLTQGTHFDYNKEVLTNRRTPFNSILLSNQTLLELNDFSGYVSLSRSISGEDGREQFVWFDDNRFNTIDALDNHSFSNIFREDMILGGLSFNRELMGFKTEIGTDYLLKLRNFDYDRLLFELPETFNPSTSLNSHIISQDTLIDLASEVNSNLQIFSGYFTTTKSFKRLDVSCGLRLEYNIQKLFYRDQVQPIFLIENKINNLYFLPTLNLKYNLSEKTKLRGIYSHTVSMPNFRELMPFEYTDMFAGEKIKGNPNLLNCNIKNVDLGFEHYPRRGEVISIYAFYKHLTNPIERVNLATASGRLQSFQNSNMAQVYGLESEFKKQINDFELCLNSAYTKSKVYLNDNSDVSVLSTNMERPLEGAPELITNADITYSKKNNFFTISTIYESRKLYSAGIQGIGDTYEVSYPMVNLSWVFNNKKIKTKILFTNIFNNNSIMRQQTDTGIKEISSMNIGRGIYLSFSKKL